MLVKDGNPQNERIINMLLNNGVTRASTTQSYSEFKAGMQAQQRRDSKTKRAPF